MIKIEQYDDDICRLRRVLREVEPSAYGCSVHFDYFDAKLVKSLILSEVERLTAERNNLIRLGGIR